MIELTRTVRRALMGIILLGILQFVLGGLIDPYGIHSIASRTVQILLAIVLLAGIVPGSYLARVVRLTGERASALPRRRVMLIAIGAPLVILTAYAYFAVGELRLSLRIDDRPSLASLWFSLAIALIQLAILTLNLLDLSRSSSRSSGA